jgi:hypothetical protein
MPQDAPETAPSAPDEWADQLHPAIGVTDGDYRVPEVDQVLALHPAHLSRSR